MVIGELARPDTPGSEVRGICASVTEGERMEDAYTTVLVNRWGQVLNRDGSLYRTDAGHPHFEVRFTDLDSARQFCEQLVRELPHVECDVTHAGRMVFRHFDDEWRRGEEERVRQLFAEQSQRIAEQWRRTRLVLWMLAGIVVVAGGFVWWVR